MNNIQRYEYIKLNYVHLLEYSLGHTLLENKIFKTRQTTERERERKKRERDRELYF